MEYVSVVAAAARMLDSASKYNDQYMHHMRLAKRGTDPLLASLHARTAGFHWSTYQQFLDAAERILPGCTTQ